MILTWMTKKACVIFAASLIILYAFFQLYLMSRNNFPFDLATIRGLRITETEKMSQEAEILPERKIQPQNWNKYRESSRKSDIREISSKLDDWKEIPGHNRKAFIYSAFHDKRQTVHVVRIISILEKTVKAIKCYMQTERGETKELVGEVRHIKEHKNLEYICSFITCPYSYYAPEDAPAKVTVGIKGTDTDQKVFINVETMDERKELGYMSVCVKPFHEFNRAVGLVEFVEMYLLMGAEHFIFYNHTVGPDVQKVLDHYITRGIVTLLPWDLPVKSKKDIRTEGLFAALNDCNLRCVNRFSYTAFVDVDEFIIPRKHESFRHLLNSLGPYDEYMFQNVFFYLFWDDDARVDEFLHRDSNTFGSRYFGKKKRGPHLLTQYKTTRCTKPNRHGTRSKYIAKPTKVTECGNHFVWTFTDGKKYKNNTLRVSEYHAVSQHYRECEYEASSKCWNKPHEIDNTAHRWMESLFMNVAHRCKSMFSEEGSCPAATIL